MDRPPTIGEGHDMSLSATHIGLLLPTREDAITGADAHPRRLVDLARHAEQTGFDSVWVGDSLLARPRLEPLVLLGAIATHTDRIGLGTAALTGAIRQPVVAAHSIATVDRLSDGRLTLAVGAGFPYPDSEAEFAAAGVPFTGRVRRLLDTVALWRAAWGDAPPDDLAGLPRPTRPGGPALWYAGAGNAALARVARHFDGWLPYVPTPGAYADQAARLGDELALTGRDAADVARGLYVTVRIDDDAERARTALDRYCEAYYGAPLELMEALQGFVVGSASEVAATLEGFALAGAGHVVMRIGSLRPEPDDIDALADALLRTRLDADRDLSSGRA